MDKLEVLVNEARKVVEEYDFTDKDLGGGWVEKAKLKKVVFKQALRKLLKQEYDMGWDERRKLENYYYDKFYKND